MRKMTVAVVGAGRLGTALARALSAEVCEVSAVVARSTARARRAARLLGGGAAALTHAQLSRIPHVDLLLITTPDDALAETAVRLAEAHGGDETARAGGARRPRAVALHASGALGSDVLAPLRARGFAVGSLHPLVSVPDASAPPEIFRGAFYCVEGDAAAARLARRLVRALGGHGFGVPTDRKALYHAAAVMASGHTVALFDAAARLLARCGLTDAQSRRVLLPLLHTTVENLSALPPSRALTGTFARADASTVRKHLAAFAREDDEAADALALYRLLGRLSLRLAEENGADADALAEIARLLDGSR